jgi:putative transposase
VSVIAGIPLPSGMGKDRCSSVERGLVPPRSDEGWRLYGQVLFNGMRSNNNATFDCKYHVVWCPKYRRDVLVRGVDVRLKQIVREVARERGAKVMELEVMPDHVHLLVDVDPQFGIHRLVKLIKGQVVALVASRVPAVPYGLPSLWPNSYFVARVGGAPLKTVKQYIENQKTCLRARCASSAWVAAASTR